MGRHGEWETPPCGLRLGGDSVTRRGFVGIRLRLGSAVEHGFYQPNVPTHVTQPVTLGRLPNSSRVTLYFA